MWWLSWFRYAFGPPTVGFKFYREDLNHYRRLYMRRWVLRVRPAGFELRLHYTATPDGVQSYLHDHPWSFVSLLLWGSYTHIRKDAPPDSLARVERRWLPGSLAYFPHGCAHVLIDVSPGGCWTLCASGPKRDNLHAEARRAGLVPSTWGAERVDLAPSTVVQGERQDAWGFWVPFDVNLDRGGIHRLWDWIPARTFFRRHPETQEFTASTRTFFELEL